MNADPTPRKLPPRANGLLDVWKDIVFVLTGMEEGPLRLTAEAHDDAPPLDLDDWDEVVEVSQFSSSGRAVVTELLGDVPEGVPQLVLPRETWFRVRCHARGRDEANARPRLSPDEDPIEEHLLQMWPAPEAEDVCHRVTDEVGQIFRSRSQVRPA